MTAEDSSAPVLRLPPRGTPRLLADERLARLARRGDRRAFETIFRRYQQEIYRFCRGILADSHEAHDALQNTMEAALRALPDDGRRVALRPWLFRVAHNESISILRRRTALVDPAALPDWPSPGTDPQAEGRERLHQLVADLNGLPERQRGALVMRELSGLSYSEIGDVLGASKAAARQAVYEARLALRDAAQGRELECEAVRCTLSEHDGRILRGRLVRAHLRDCEPCRDFHAAIRQRRADLRMLCPPLAAPGLLAPLLGQVGASVGTTAASKTASIAATVVIGAGAAGVTGKLDLPLGSSADGPHGARSHTTGAGPDSPPPAVGSVRSIAHGPSDVAPHPKVGPKRHAATNGNRAPGGGAQPPVSPPDGASGNAFSNGPAAAGGGPPASSPPSGSPPGQASGGGPPSGSPPGLAPAASRTPGPPQHAQGSPGSPPAAALGVPPHAQAHLPSHAQGSPPPRGPHE